MSVAKKGQQPLWLGGAAASMAACFTHPLDQTKYRMQVQASKQNMLRALVGYAGRDGIFSLWSGLSASLLRQSTYSTARFGVYNYLARQTKELSGTKQLSLGSTITCAGLAGGIAGVIGNPTEV
jgi:dicarboxylate transporter 10